MTDPVPIRPDGLQLDENRGFQQRFWTAQRVAWGVFLLVALTAATGISGRGGPLAQGQTLVGTANVTWPRVTRLGVPESLTVVLPARQDTHEITLSDELQRLYQIETITPRPVTESGGSPLRLAFSPDASPQAVHLSLRPQKAGIATFAIGIDGSQATLTIYVLP